MKKRYFWNAPLLLLFFVFGMAFFCLLCAACGAFDRPAAPAPVWTVETVGTIDTSGIDLRGQETVGNVRAVCADRYEDSNLLIDHTGNVWEVNLPLESKALYQLWFDDMGTPEIEDDEIIDVWILVEG